MRQTELLPQVQVQQQVVVREHERGHTLKVQLLYGLRDSGLVRQHEVLVLNDHGIDAKQRIYS